MSSREGEKLKDAARRGAGPVSHEKNKEPQTPPPLITPPAPPPFRPKTNPLHRRGPRDPRRSASTTSRRP